MIINEREFGIRHTVFPYWDNRFVVLDYLGIATFSEISDYVKYDYVDAQLEYLNTIQSLYINDFEYNSDKSKSILMEFKLSIDDDIRICEEKINEETKNEKMYMAFMDMKEKQEIYLSITKRMNELRSEREGMQEKINELLTQSKYEESNVSKERLDRIDKEISDLKYDRDSVDQQLMYMKSSIQEVKKPEGKDKLEQTLLELQNIHYYVSTELSNWKEYEDIEFQYKQRHEKIRQIINIKKEDLQKELQMLELVRDKLKPYITLINENIKAKDRNEMFISMIKNLDKFIVVNKDDVVIEIRNDDTRKKLIGIDFKIIEEE